MQKFFLVIVILLLSCSSNKTETPVTDSKDSSKSFEQGLKDYIKETPATNRDAENNDLHQMQLHFLKRIERRDLGKTSMLI